MGWKIGFWFCILECVTGVMIPFIDRDIRNMMASEPIIAVAFLAAIAMFGALAWMCRKRIMISRQTHRELSRACNGGNAQHHVENQNGVNTHMFCKNCGAEVDEAKFCQNCGAKNDEIEQLKNIKSDQKPKKKFGCGFCLLLITGILALLTGIAAIMTNGFSDIPVDTSDLIQACEINQAQADAIMYAMVDSGFNSVFEVTHDEGLDNSHVDGETGYRVNTDVVDNVILYLSPNKTVNYIRYADHDLYANGQKIATVADYVLNRSDANQIQLNCKEAIKQCLKSPSTAKFPSLSEWAMSRDPEKIVVQSYVDSQNGFGAEVRSQFQLILTPSGYSATSIIIDGQEVLAQ